MSIYLAKSNLETKSSGEKAKYCMRSKQFIIAKGNIIDVLNGIRLSIFSNSIWSGFVGLMFNVFSSPSVV